MAVYMCVFPSFANSIMLIWCDGIKEALCDREVVGSRKQLVSHRLASGAARHL